ncbi:MAG: hypothetical protein Q7R69_01765 [bacterium]|nr:hypothetical protein [bacterium]
MKKIIPIILLAIIIPQVAFAAWWNPFTWRIFNKKQEVKIEQPVPSESATSSVVVPNKVEKPTVTTEKVQPVPVVDNQSVEIEKLKREVEKLKEKQSTANNIEKETLPINNITTSNIATPAVETWESLERRFFIEADSKGWTSISITRQREERYYRKESNQWVRKNSKAEIQQPYATPPTAQQLGALFKMCGEVPEVNSLTCKDSKFLDGYMSNMSFRILIDAQVEKYNKAKSEQQQQSITAQKQQSDCLLEPTPPELRTLSPQQQRRIREVKCGTNTPQSDLEYKLYQQQQYQECVNKNPTNYSWYCEKPIFY